MINFATLQGLTIPEGVVTQIADASGRVIWALNTATNEPPAIFEVTKKVSNTYAGETTYENEEFILLDIYPKKGGTVSVTYGGLTKTITDTSGAEEPNAQQVFFGTFNGVSDSVATPASGRLTIEGAYRGYGASSYTVYSNKENQAAWNGVNYIVDWGHPVYIGMGMFYACEETSLVVPEGVEYIGSGAFGGCENLASLILPTTLKEIGGNVAFAANTANYVTKTVTVLATTPPVWDGTIYAPANTTGFSIVHNDRDTIVVQKNCGAAYKAANGWSNHADIIREAS